MQVIFGGNEKEVIQFVTSTKILVLLISVCLAFSYVANAEIVYPYNIGDINATCPDNATCYNNATCPGWQKFGTHCFLLINQSLPFSDANNFCLSPDNGPSVAYRIDNWFLTRTIVENYAQLQSLDGHVAFWTGFYLVKSSNNLLPQYINRTSAINSTSIYNPLWAWTEPDLDFVEIQYANSSNISCIAMDIDLNNETNYGWKLHDCNDRLPFICQTFICYDDDFRCKDNSGCIPRTAVCDNFTDCQDRSDEQNCKHDYCDCGALIHRDHYSQIYSPGFNGPCNKKVQCDYQIIQNPGTHIRLNFISLDLSKDDTLIIEGIDSDEQFPLTSQKSFTYLTSGSRIRIRFSHSSGNGFQLQYFVEDVDSCIRRFESWNGTFSPPRQLPENGHYKNSLDCIWTIANKENGFIGLQIPTFELAITDWLVIYDGMPSQRNIFGNFTCFNPPPTAFATDAAVVNFRFYSAPSSVGDDGFQVTFKQSCLNERLTSSYGVIESPNFRTPSKRTPFHCSWIIQVPHQEGLSGCEFSVFFDNLNLTNKDWITVESGSELITIDAFSLPILMHRAKTPRLMIDMFAETWQFASKISYSIDCQPPMLNDPYTVMTYTEPNRFAYRSTVSFHCFPGYTLSGYSVIQCQLGGKWSLPVPSCLTSVCVVTNITNGYIASLNRTLGVMTWGCLNGYFPDELFQSTCNNSVWVPPPECLEVNCPPLPQLYPNKAALSHGQTQAQLKNITKTSNGSALHSYAEYECKNGYDMRGKSPPYFICGYPNGSKWVPDLAEKNFYCQAPGCYASDVLHGNFSHQWVPANDSNEINCDVGFTHDGINQIKCIYENGNYTWDHQGPYRCLPSCQGNPCGPNGRCQISQDNDTYTCDCDKGYRMTVNGSNRTCEDINECTDHIDLCDSITSTCQNTIGSYLCICNSGTEMYENATMNTYNFPNNKSLIFDRSCIRTRCPIPQFTEYMVTTNDLFLNNSSVTYYCPKALQSLTMTCQASVWSKPDENFCTTTISCPKPNVTISTILTPNNTIYSVYDTISYSCEPGYTLIGPNETICLETGWNSNAPICTMQKCEDISELLQNITYLNVAVSTPPSPTHESWIKGTKLHFSCENGHVLNGSSTMYCSNATDGTLRWSENTLPACEEDLCIVSTPADVIPSASTIKVGQAATFRCLQPNYILSDSTQLECSSSTSSTASLTRVSRSASFEPSPSTTDESETTKITDSSTQTWTSEKSSTTKEPTTTTNSHSKTNTMSQTSTPYESSSSGPELQTTTIGTNEPTTETSRSSRVARSVTYEQSPSTTNIQSTKNSIKTTQGTLFTKLTKPTPEATTSIECSKICTSTQISSTTEATTLTSTSVESTTTTESSSTQPIQTSSNPLSTLLPTHPISTTSETLSTSSESETTQASTAESFAQSTQTQESLSSTTSTRITSNTESTKETESSSSEKITTSAPLTTSKTSGEWTTISLTSEGPASTSESRKMSSIAYSETSNPTKETTLITSTLSNEMRLSSTETTPHETTTMESQTTSTSEHSSTPSESFPSTETSQNPSTTVKSETSETFTTLSSTGLSTQEGEVTSSSSPVSSSSHLALTTEVGGASTSGTSISISSEATKFSTSTEVYSTSTSIENTSSKTSHIPSSISPTPIAESTPVEKSTKMTTTESGMSSSSTNYVTPSSLLSSEAPSSPVTSSSFSEASTSSQASSNISTTTTKHGSITTTTTSTAKTSTIETTQPTQSLNNTTSYPRTTSTATPTRQQTASTTPNKHPQTTATSNITAETIAPESTTPSKESTTTKKSTATTTSQIITKGTTNTTSTAKPTTTTHSTTKPTTTTVELNTTRTSTTLETTFVPTTNRTTAKEPMTTSKKQETSTTAYTSTIYLNTTAYSGKPTQTETGPTTNTTSTPHETPSTTTTHTSQPTYSKTSPTTNTTSTPHETPSTTTTHTSQPTYTGTSSTTNTTSTSHRETSPTTKTTTTTTKTTITRSPNTTTHSTIETTTSHHPTTTAEELATTTCFCWTSSTIQSSGSTEPTSSMNTITVKHTPGSSSVTTEKITPKQTESSSHITYLDSTASSSNTTHLYSTESLSNTTYLGSTERSSHTPHLDSTTLTTKAIYLGPEPVISRSTTTTTSTMSTTSARKSTNCKKIHENGMNDPTDCGSNNKSEDGASDELDNMDFVVDNLLRKARSAELETNIHSGQCIIDWGGVSNAYVGSSVIFFCTISPTCRDHEMSDQGEYVCQVMDNDEILDSVTFFLAVSDAKSEKSWQKVIQSTNETKKDFLESTNLHQGWNFSEQWTQMENGSWSFSVGNSSDDENYLISPPLRVENDWLEITTELAACEKCQITAYNYSSDQVRDSIPLKEFHRLGTLSADRASSYSTQFQIPHPLLWIMLKVSGSTDNITLKGINLKIPTCPKIKLGLTIFPETIASPNATNVEGNCVEKATRKGFRPELICTKFGTWALPEKGVPVSSCFCSEGYVDYFGECVRKGPVCYECEPSPISKCNSTIARHCDVGESCRTHVQLNSSIPLIEKSCAKDCVDRFKDFEQCQAGLEECTLCCNTDYCSPINPVKRPIRFSSLPPVCIDQQPMQINCAPRIEVQQIGENVFLPTVVPWPEVKDNDPNYTISSNLPALGSSPYAFGGTETSIVWTATDRHGVEAQCVTQIVYMNNQPPSVKCPEIYLDYMAGTTSRQTSLRLPEIKAKGSVAQLVFEPRNGTIINVEEPLLINVTAIDTSGNMGRCQFWYMAVPSDCPLWKIDPTEFLCTQAENTTICYRRKPCTSKQLPVEFKAIACVPGQGWRFVQTEVIADHLNEALPMIRPPTCMEEQSSMVTMSITFDIAKKQSQCNNPLLDLLQKHLDNFIGRTCTDVSWHLAEVSTVNSNIILNYTTNGYDTSSVLACIRLITSTLTEELVRLNSPCLPPIRSHSIKYHLQCVSGWGSNTNFKCELCSPGYFFSAESCIECPKGTFSTISGAFGCQPCPGGKSTLNTGASSIAECIDACGPGFYSPSGLGPCKACSKGTYQPSFAQTTCLSCFFNLTTAETASKSVGDCKAKCQPGSYGRGGIQPCHQCPMGYYQGEVGASECQRCAQGTTTLTVGATSQFQCIFLSCDTVQCLNGGICREETCQCQPGFAGSECSIVLDLCKAAYCVNDGTCSFEPTIGPTCACPPGLTGSRCETEIRKHIKQDSVSSSTIDCSDPNACTNGICIPGNHSCTCNWGYKNDVNGKCVAMSACEFHPCRIETSYGCMEMNMTLPDDLIDPNDFMCICNTTAGWTGKFCESRIGDCSEELPCQNNGTCIQTRNTTDGLPTSVCLCQPGWTGRLCADPIENPCENIKTCIHGTCRPYGEHNNTYICDCHAGFKGEFCDTPLNPCSYELANYTDCLNGGTCHSWGQLNNGGYANCTCVQEFNGKYCENEIDHCHPNPCQHGTCETMLHGYHCACDPSYTGKYCNVSIDPCSNGPFPDSNPCGMGTCKAISYGYNGAVNCTCSDGWTGTDCRKSRNSCTQNQTDFCQNDSVCIPLPNLGSFPEYTCQCPWGEAGRSCGISIDYCKQSDHDICMHNATCVYNNSSYTFECQHCPLNTIGLNCEQFMDPCNNMFCGKHGYCVNKDNQVKCECNVGWRGDNCSIGNNFCSLPNDEQYCLNGGSCVFSEEKDFSYCICPANYTGQRCENPTSYYNFNLYFTGNPSVEKNQTIVSVDIPPSFMREFSICGWVRYGTDSTIQQVHELIAGQQQLAPYAVLGIWNGTNVVQPIITFSNTGVQITGQDDEKLHSSNFTLYTWHHFCVVSPRLYLNGWTYYLDGNMVDHNNQAGVSPEQNVSILLGQNVEGTERFIGQLSLVQFYGKSLNDSDVASMAFDCIKYVKEYGADLTVAISWNQYTPVDKFNQGIQTIYPGICVTSSCIPGQPDCAKDKTPPTVVRCPSYTYLNESKRLTTVKWDESLDEMFYDNNYIVELTSNYRSGQTFTWGFYHVVYKARDAAGNLATCEFDLVIAKDVCTSPQAVNNRTSVTFTEVVTEYTRKQANLSCIEPTDVFNQPVPPFYTCDVMGRWDRLGQFSYFPGCSSTVNPSQTLNGTVIFYNLCENSAALMEMVKQTILNSSQRLSSQYPGQQICSDEKCTNVIINPLCTSNQRRRRQVNNETVPIAFAIQTNLTSRDILPYVNGSMLANSLNIINPNHDITCDSSSENPQRYPSRSGDILCASCTAGQYFDQTECVPCPKNTYSTNGTGSCIKCTSPRNVTAGTGSSDPRSCYIDCDTGSYYSYAISNCTPCAQGTYQNQTGQLACEQCPDQSTTSGTGTKLSSDCYLCPAGQELDDTETCVACQNGTFRGAGSPSACVSCQPGFTSKQGGTAPTDCNEINCPPGTYIKPNPPSPVDQTRYKLNDVCVFCDYGYYEENFNASSCTICQSGYTTTQKGSKSPKDCVPGNTIRCNPYDQNSCPNGTTCAQKPDGGGYVCVPMSATSEPLPPHITPVWVWILIGFLALALTVGIVVLVFVFRKKWLIWFAQTCPCCMPFCPCKKLSPDDLEAEAIPRNDSDARVTGSSETGFTDFKDEEGAHQRFVSIPRAEIRADRPHFESQESAENPLDEIRDILQYFAPPTDSKSRHSPPPTPPPIPQSRLTVQTSLRTAQEDRSHFDYDMRYSLDEAAARRRVMAQSSTQRNEMFSYQRSAFAHTTTEPARARQPSPDYSPPPPVGRIIPESRTVPTGRRRGSSSSESEKRWTPPKDAPKSAVSLDNDDDLFFS